MASGPLSASAEPSASEPAWRTAFATGLGRAWEPAWAGASASASASGSARAWTADLRRRRGVARSSLQASVASGFGGSGVAAGFGVSTFAAGAGGAGCGRLGGVWRAPASPLRPASASGRRPGLRRGRRAGGGAGGGAGVGGCRRCLSGAGSLGFRLGLGSASRATCSGWVARAPAPAPAHARAPTFRSGVDGGGSRTRVLYGWSSSIGLGITVYAGFFGGASGSSRFGRASSGCVKTIGSRCCSGMACGRGSSFGSGFVSNFPSGISFGNPVRGAGICGGCSISGSGSDLRKETT